MKLTEPKKLRLEASVYKVSQDNEEVKTLTASAHKLNILQKEDIKDNSNFLYLQADLANAGQINKNGHGMTIKDAVNVYKKWEHTFVDVEHETEDVRGFIVKSVLTDKDTKEVLTEERALASTKPINISVGFVIWSNIDPSLTTLLQKIGASESEANGLISLSLELQFCDFHIYKGSSKNMFEGELITEDDKIEGLYESLKDFGGTGKDKDGTPVYLICCGEDLTPLGCGLVTSPAADVSGISSKINASEDSENEEPEEGDDEEHEDDCDCKDCQEKKMSAANQFDILIAIKELTERTERATEGISNTLKIMEKITNAGSQSKNSDVKGHSMKITNISDITDENLKEIKACELLDFIKEELAVKSGEHQTALEAKANEVNDAKEAARVASEALTSVNANLEKLTQELNDLKEARAAEALEASFNDRMSALDDEFELDDTAREVIAAQIKELSDEAFASWKKGFDILAADKNKTVIAAKNEANKENKTVVASEENANEDPLETLKAKISAMPSSTDVSKDLIAQFKDAFSLENGFTVTQ